MSTRVALGERPPLRVKDRLLATVAVAWARLLVRRRTVHQLANRLDAILRRCSRPATVEEARRADEVVCAVRWSYVSHRHATERAVAAALFCALHGGRVRWCWGVRTPPAETTAWIEAAGGAFGAAYNVQAAFTTLVATAEVPS